MAGLFSATLYSCLFLSKSPRKRFLLAWSVQLVFALAKENIIGFGQIEKSFQKETFFVLDRSKDHSKRKYSLVLVLLWPKQKLIARLSSPRQRDASWRVLCKLSCCLSTNTAPHVALLCARRMYWKCRRRLRKTNACVSYDLTCTILFWFCQNKNQKQNFLFWQVKIPLQKKKNVLFWFCPKPKHKIVQVRLRHVCDEVICSCLSVGYEG